MTLKPVSAQVLQHLKVLVGFIWLALMIGVSVAFQTVGWAPRIIVGAVWAALALATVGIIGGWPCIHCPHFESHGECCNCDEKRCP